MLELWSWMFSFNLFDDFLSFLSNLTKGTACFFANQTAFFCRSKVVCLSISPSYIECFSTTFSLRKDLFVSLAPTIF